MMKIDAQGKPADIGTFDWALEKIFRATMQLPWALVAGERVFKAFATDNTKFLSVAYLGGRQRAFSANQCYELQGIPMLLKPDVPDGELWMTFDTTKVDYAAPFEIVMENLG